MADSGVGVNVVAASEAWRALMEGWRGKTDAGCVEKEGWREKERWRVAERSGANSGAKEVVK